MKKIPTIFVRDWNGDRSRVLNEVNPGCEWVLAGEGIPTRKLDGTCCMVRGNRLFKRRELKPGQPDPDGFEMADHDDDTGKTVGWMPVGDGPEDAMHRAAWTGADTWSDGTYELVGPKVQRNPDGFKFHLLIKHGGGPAGKLDCDARDFESIRAYLESNNIEGIVWHHPDGRMAKIKRRDFGLEW